MTALDDLRQHAAKEHEAARLRRALIEQRQSLVRAAFDQGYTGTEVAQALGRSKERAYQIRDGGKRAKPKPPRDHQ